MRVRARTLVMEGGSMSSTMNSRLSSLIPGRRSFTRVRRDILGSRPLEYTVSLASNALLKAADWT